jgi:hypothetical protein
MGDGIQEAVSVTVERVITFFFKAGKLPGLWAWVLSLRMHAMAGERLDKDGTPDGLK